ncbi:MAG: hypothetical protein AAGI45_22625 [Cyanobacteria bacterium P01_H01_bin.26]
MSNLLKYISHLMQDDDALHQFTIDPITDAENTHGLTKAERAVLRRTVHGLSNNSVNGYSMVRHGESYRRSLRLLQNVLHNTGSKMIMDTVATADGEYTYHVVVYAPKLTESRDFTCKTNYDLKLVGGPYATTYMSSPVVLPSDSPTIKDVLDKSGLGYEIVKNKDGEEFVSAFYSAPAKSGIKISADISDPCYDLSIEKYADFAFWFYSINGKAGTAHSGKVGGSFANYQLKPGDTVYWQLIAPDKTYGFQPCVAHDANAYAKAQKAQSAS